MGRRRRVLAAVAIVALSSVVVGVGAVGAEDTNTQFTITGGNLAITVPSNADLGSVTAGSALVSGSLGTVSVSDTRQLFAAAWTASVSSTDFTTGGASAEETVSKTNVAYVTGAPTASTGTGVFTPVGAVTFAAPGVAGAWVGTGNNSVSWNPTVTVTLPPGQSAGTYTGVITHSVA